MWNVCPIISRLPNYILASSTFGSSAFCSKIQPSEAWRRGGVCTFFLRDIWCTPLQLWTPAFCFRGRFSSGSTEFDTIPFCRNGFEMWVLTLILSNPRRQLHLHFFLGWSMCHWQNKILEMYALENIAVKWGMVFMSCIMKYYMHCGYEQVRTYRTSFSYHVNSGLINNGLLFMVVIGTFRHLGSNKGLLYYQSCWV